MNSIQSALFSNPSSRLAEISLLIRAHYADNKLLIVVEGESDKDIYSCFYPEKRYEVYFSKKYSGCLDLVEMSRELNSKYPNRYIIIKDADFDHLNGISYSDIPNMFLTDTHDIETMMLTESFTKQIECDFSIAESSKMINDAINEISHLSYIKWLNNISGTKLNINDCCKVGNCYDGTANVSIAQWLIKINSHPANISKKHFCEADIIDFEKNNFIMSKSSLQLICGHDMVDAIERKIHACCRKNVGKKNIEKTLKKCFTKNEYEKTKLYSYIKLWLSHNNFI